VSTFTGYDKLKPHFGFPIHAGVDGYSRKVLWVELERSNHLPEITARYSRNPRVRTYIFEG